MRPLKDYISKNKNKILNKDWLSKEEEQINSSNDCKGSKQINTKLVYKKNKETLNRNKKYPSKNIKKL